MDTTYTVSIDGKPCVTLAQAAQLAGVSYRVMAAHVAAGRITAFTPGGLERWIPVDELGEVPIRKPGRPRESVVT